MKRQRSQQKRIHHTEHGDVGADSKGKNQNSDKRENRIAPHGAEGVAQVEPQNVERLEPTCFTMLLRSLLHSSEANQRLTPRFFRRQTALHVLFNRQLEVSGHLCIEFTIRL